MILIFLFHFSLTPDDHLPIILTTSLCHLGLPTGSLSIKNSIRPGTMLQITPLYPFTHTMLQITRLYPILPRLTCFCFICVSCFHVLIVIVFFSVLTSFINPCVFFSMKISPLIIYFCSFCFNVYTSI